MGRRRLSKKFPEERKNHPGCFEIQVHGNHVAHLHFVVGHSQQRLILLDRNQRDVVELGGKGGNPTQTTRRRDDRTDSVETRQVRGYVVQPLDRHQAGGPRQPLRTDK